MAPDQELAQVLAGRLLGQHAGLDQHVRGSLEGFSSLRDQPAALSSSPGQFADRGCDDARLFFGQVVPGAADDAEGQVVRVRSGAGEAARRQREVLRSGQ